MTVVRRPPNRTYVKAEGEKGHWGEFASTTLDDVWGRLEGFFQDRQGVDSTELVELAERIVDRTDLNTAGRKITVGDPVHLPWTSYEPGDIVTLNLAPKDVKRELRVAAITVAMGPNDAAPRYDVHFGAPVLSNDAAMAQGLRTVLREFRRPTSAGIAADGQPTVPIPPPATSNAIEDASWVFASVNSTAADQIRADQVCTGTDDEITIRDGILANLPNGGQVGFLPGRYKFTGELTNADVSGNNINALFDRPLRFRGSPGVIFEFAANPAASSFLIRCGDLFPGSVAHISFDHIQFVGGASGSPYANADGVLMSHSTGPQGRFAFNHCSFYLWGGDYMFWGERHFFFNIGEGHFLSCTPTTSFIHVGGFSDGLCILHDNNFDACTGPLWTGAGFSLGGIFTDNNFSSGMTIPTADPWVAVYHNRIAGVQVAGDHNGVTGGIINNTLADAKGDIIAATANDTWAKLTVGANKRALHADSAQTTGLAWTLPGGKDSIGGFRRENLAANLTASQLERSISASLDAALPVVITHASSVIGVSAASTEARTVGTATFEVYKNGVATGLTCVLNGTDTTYAFGVQAIDLDAVAAGDRLDIRVTTSSDWAPTTADVEAVLVLQYDPA